MQKKYTENQMNSSILLEMYTVGKYMRISAIDPKTNIEIHLVTGKHISRAQIKNLAQRKLAYVLKKKGLSH